MREGEGPAGRTEQFLTKTYLFHEVEALFDLFNILPDEFDVPGIPLQNPGSALQSLELVFKLPQGPKQCEQSDDQD